jgi:hypothetical protein
MHNSLTLSTAFATRRWPIHLGNDTSDALNRVEHKEASQLAPMSNGLKFGKDRGLSLRFIKGRGIVKAHMTTQGSRVWVYRPIFPLSDHLFYDTF